MFASAFVFSFNMMQWIYRKEGKNVEELDRMLWYLAIGIVVGARLGHTLIYDPPIIFLTLLKSWRSGKAVWPVTVAF